VRHHHHFRATRAVADRVGERLAGAEQTVVFDQFDALPQLGRGGIARLGKAQDLRELATGAGEAVSVATLLQQRQAFVAKLVDPAHAHPFDAHAGIGHRAAAWPDGFGQSQPAPGGVEVGLGRILLGTTDQRAFHCGQALHGARLARADLQCLAQPGQCTALALLAQSPLLDVGFGLAVELPQAIGFIHTFQVGHDLGVARAQCARDGRHLVRATQRFDVVAGSGQRGVALCQQRYPRLREAGLGRRVAGRCFQDRPVQRDGGLGVLVEASGGERGGGTLAGIVSAAGATSASGACQVSVSAIRSSPCTVTCPPPSPSPSRAASPLSRQPASASRATMAAASRRVRGFAWNGIRSWCQMARRLDAPGAGQVGWTTPIARMPCP